MASLTAEPKVLKRRDSFSMETAEIDQIANMDLAFDENIHVQAPPPSESDLAAAVILKTAILNLDKVKASDPLIIAPITTPANLQRILRARKFDQADALYLAEETVDWRIDERPDILRADDVLENECCTGKARIGDYDRHGRPILLLDSWAENTKLAKNQIKHLTWQMMRLSRRFETSPNVNIEKNLVFVNLEKFSLFNCPSMENSKKTITILSKFFCERMGHGICWQPPFYFSVFLRTVRPFVDPVTYGKVVIIKGDYSPGTKNDEKMNLLVGTDWRVKCCVDGKQQDKNSTPGYDHATYWPAAVAEEEEYFRRRSTQDVTATEEVKAVQVENEQVENVIETKDTGETKDSEVSKLKTSTGDDEKGGWC